jgi:hypothetical protein
MPTLLIIDSIKILIYFDDHFPPHFHAKYNEFEEVIIIESLETYSGRLPNKQRKKVLEWAKENQDFLKQKWDQFSQ